MVFASLVGTAGVVAITYITYRVFVSKTKEDEKQIVMLTFDENDNLFTCNYLTDDDSMNMDDVDMYNYISRLMYKGNKNNKNDEFFNLQSDEEL